VASDTFAAGRGPNVPPLADLPNSAYAQPQPDWLGRNVYVSNLPPLHVFSSVMPSEQHVHNLFSQFGEIERLRVVRDRMTNYPVGIAMVLFKDPGAAQRAVTTINASGIGATASMWLPKAVLLGAEDLPASLPVAAATPEEAAETEADAADAAAPPSA
jgi:RNA recognition motif-containing protein